MLARTRPTRTCTHTYTDGRITSLAYLRHGLLQLLNLCISHERGAGRDEGLSTMLTRKVANRSAKAHSTNHFVLPQRRSNWTVAQGCAFMSSSVRRKVCEKLAREKPAREMEIRSCEFHSAFRVTWANSNRAFCV